MRRGRLKKMHNVICRNRGCNSAKLIETKDRRIAIRDLVCAGWQQTRTGWECYDCLKKKAEKASKENQE